MNNNKLKNWQATKRQGGVNAALCFTSNIFCLLGLLMLMTLVLQSLNNNNNYEVQAKSLLQAKFPDKLKLLQNPAPLIKFRPKRDTFNNGRQPEVDQNESDYYDDNYDEVLPGGTETGSSATEGDQISERAQQVAESFKNMWQSLTDSVRHCINALRAMFGEEGETEDLTPEQEQQLLAEMEERYRRKHQQDNEVIMNVYQNSL